jgi:(1->4)-alpha-D-glucan 1-alpha-D-glucosylmutase
VEAFHEANQVRLRETPRAMLAAQTHDTKRSPDVRARLVALTEISAEWSAHVRDWHELNAGFASDDAPGWAAELFLYQTLVGAWPISWERLQGYLVKAMREAKRHTNWVSPNQTWEADLLAFAHAVTTSTAFLERFEPFVERVALAGERTSLGQAVLRLTAPGVPDTYQGDELWDRSLVDPDNRRAVDWDIRRDLLRALRTGALPTRKTAKLFVTAQLLALRAMRPDAFTGAYTPIDVHASRVVAFQRGDDVVAALPLDSTPLAFAAPPGNWQNVLEPLSALYPVAPAVYVRDLVDDLAPRWPGLA